MRFSLTHSLFASTFVHAADFPLCITISLSSESIHLPRKFLISDDECSLITAHKDSVSLPHTGKECNALYNS